jgi:hypothetical protein
MQTQSISLEELTDILERMEVHDIQDFGGVLIQTGIHPEHEECSVVQDAMSGKQALITAASGIYFMQ